MINWDNISTVFLDMDGTLLDLHFDNHFWLEHVPKRFAQAHNVSVAQAKEQLFPKMLALRGKLQWYCTDFWSKELDLPIIELKREVSHLIRLRNNTSIFLAALRAANKEIVLFTNAHEHTVELKMEKTGLASAFDKTITSHSLGIAKEAPSAWEAMSKHHTFQAEHSLFIDDNFSVLDCAQKAGIGYLFGIEKPDSKGDKLSHEHYVLLKNFKQIMPV